jgi:hypothetical protein
MCTEPDHPGAVAAWAIRPESAVAPADPVTLVPVDAVTLTTLVDNSTDLLLADQGPVHRHGLLAATGAQRLATNVLDTGETYDIPWLSTGFPCWLPSPATATTTTCCSTRE